jgi:hypothetical protein
MLETNIEALCYKEVKYILYLSRSEENSGSKLIWILLIQKLRENIFIINGFSLVLYIAEFIKHLSENFCRIF